MMELTPSAERKREGHVTAELLKSGKIKEKIVKFRLFLSNYCPENVGLIITAGLFTTQL